MSDKKYGVSVTTTDGKSSFWQCEDFDIDAEEGTLTLYKPENGFLNMPVEHRVYMLRHISYYDVQELSA